MTASWVFHGWTWRAVALAAGVSVCTFFAQASAAGRTEPGAPAGPRRVLFLTLSSGFVHPVVKRSAPQVLSIAERQLTEAARERFAVDASQDPAVINPGNLARYDAVVFYTTGNLPISADNRQALLDYIRAGHGFVGIHCATDTFYDWPEYGQMIGAYFDGHPWHQSVRILVTDQTHPAVSHLGASFEIHDEIYQFRAFDADKVHVLLKLDNSSVDLGKGKRADGSYALAWSRSYGDGRVFYTALGHGENVWKDPRFLEHLLGGIEWTMNTPRHANEK